MVEYRSVSIDSELRPGKRVLWLGHPQGSLFSRDDAVLIPISVVWLGFMVFVEAAVQVNGIELSNRLDPFGLVVAPFLAIGLYATLGRFLYRARRRHMTDYAVTNQRVMGKSGNTVRRLSLTRLPVLETTSGGTRGRIVFGTMDLVAGKYANTGLDWLPHGDLPVAFFDIPDAESVARIIEDAARAA
jgi:hypothetical protein